MKKFNTVNIRWYFSCQLCICQGVNDGNKDTSFQKCTSEEENDELGGADVQDDIMKEVSYFLALNFFLLWLVQFVDVARATFLLNVKLASLLLLPLIVLRE